MSDGSSDRGSTTGGDTVTVTVRDGDDRVDLSVQRGRTLRDVLLERGLSPYTDLTASLNCGGRGICATCGVRLVDGKRVWGPRE